MTDLGTRLRDALRDEEDERLSAVEAAAMRRAIVAAAGEHQRESARGWFQPLAVAASLVAMVAIGIAIGHRFDVPTEQIDDSNGADTALPAQQRPGGARQLQFSTPGGTRIIWIFNSDLDLKTTP
jgi:hypothetical protein